MAENCPKYAGTCVGGPRGGTQITVRCPKGFLLVDREAARAWLYDFTPAEGAEPDETNTVHGSFAAREPDGRELDDDGRFDAAASADWDVVAHAG